MTKPRPNRLGMYEDVKQILDAALASNGGMYQCASDGDATHWRQRAYRFRKLYAEVHHPTGKGMSPYDKLVLPRPDGSIVRIEVRRQIGVFVPNETPQLDEIFGDDLLGEAEAFAKRLEGNTDVH